MEYYKVLRKHVGNNPIILPGSVVIIVNSDGEILLQLRSDETWGLPGGLMELGESFGETAKREVFEETGLKLGELILIDVFSGSRYYLKIKNGDEIYSATAVYTATEYEGSIKPDDKESLALKFFSLEDLPERIGQGYKDYIYAYKNFLLK